jgi:hypothetical protein
VTDLKLAKKYSGAVIDKTTLEEIMSVLCKTVIEMNGDRL